MALTKAHKRMLAELYVDVRDFGAVGDGVTDDTAAIQAALDSTAKKIIFNDNSTFLVTSELTTSVADRSIFGYGATITTDGSIDAAANVLIVSGIRTTVAGLKITGITGTTLCSAIFIGGVPSVTIQDCRIFDFDNGTGIGANSSGVSHVIQNNHLDNCAPVSFGGSQYGSIACNASKSVITGNRILRNDLTGISVFGGDYVTISDNYIEGTGSLATVGGIILDGLTIGCVIDGNTINTGDVEGIQIAGSITTYGGASKDHIISNNTILNSDYSAITLYGTETDSVINVTVSGNHMKSAGTTGRGIELNRVAKINITGNYVYGYNVGLNVVNASPDVNLTGNFFENQNTTGVQCFGAKWNVSGNKIIGNGSTTTGMIFNGSTIAGEQMISGNQISDCATGINGTFSGSARTYIYCNHFVDNTTDYSLTNQTTNSVNYNTFDSSLSGTATLSSGTVTVNIVALTAEDKIVLTPKTPSGTVGAAYVSSRTNGSGFVISSTSGTDTSTYTWELVR